MLRWMNKSTQLGLLLLAMAHFAAHPLLAADTLESLIAGAKKEDELVFIAGAQTFGGRKGLSEIEAAFNKRYGLNMKISFAAGPDMNARAARHITEIKAGRKVSSDIFLGSQSHQALLHKENALEKINYSGVFSWVTKEMEIFPTETVLTYTSPNGIVYNANLIPKDKAPKNYADLIDPKLSPTWAGKIAIPPYVAWLAELSLAWGQDKVKDYTRKLVSISGGRLRYSEEERVVSGEFPIMANFGDALSAMWTWQPKGAPLVADQYRLFSTERAEEHGASQFGQTVRRFYDYQRGSRRPPETRIAQLSSRRGLVDAEIFKR
jgi:hypothetical protein